ncbi:IS110 family transposase [Kitasatospora sp. NPDC051914]|uniref:IS110 family transposase n=1 Tax=Kitasatospora sp. NPDC051914 TaxID=3154945 RepID=UPI00344042DB
MWAGSSPGGLRSFRGILSLWVGLVRGRLRGRALLLRARRSDSRLPSVPCGRAPLRGAGSRAGRRTVADATVGAEGVDEVTEESVEKVERVAAIDIAKASGMVCVRVPHDDGSGRRVQRVFHCAATSGAILDLADHLICQGVTQVVMEASRPTGSLVLPVGGPRTGLLARQRPRREERPGRPKTVELDSVWPAKLAERGMLRRSFVPPKPVRELQDLTRTRAVLTHERTRHKQRGENSWKTPRSSCPPCSPTSTVPPAARCWRHSSPEKAPRTSWPPSRTARSRRPRPSPAEALRGGFDEHHAFMLRTLLDMIDHLTVQTDRLTARITHLFAQPADASGPGPEAPASGASGNDTPGQGLLLALTDVERLDETPGVGPGTAQVILAGTGLDMAAVFPTPGHLVSWAQLSPRAIQSGGKHTSGPTGKGNPWLRGALGEAAISAARTDTFLGARHRRPVKRRGHMKALVAVARSILVAVRHLMTDPYARYHDLGPDWHTRHLDPARRTRDLVRRLKALGHDATLTPATSRPPRPQPAVTERRRAIPCCPANPLVFRSATGGTCGPTCTERSWPRSAPTPPAGRPR